MEILCGLRHKKHQQWDSKKYLRTVDIYGCNLTTSSHKEDFCKITRHVISRT